MDHQEYEAALAFTYRTLDAIDLIPYIKSSYSSEELMEKLRRKYNNSPLTNNNYMEGYLFNVINEVEFIEYLEKRYPDKFHTTEVISYIIDWNDNQNP